MYVTDNTGRRYRIATKEEEARIREGIAADPDARELTDEEMAELRPLVELNGPLAALRLRRPRSASPSAFLRKSWRTSVRPGRDGKPAWMRR